MGIVVLGRLMTGRDLAIGVALPAVSATTNMNA